LLLLLLLFFFYFFLIIIIIIIIINVKINVTKAKKLQGHGTDKIKTENNKKA